MNLFRRIVGMAVLLSIAASASLIPSPHAIANGTLRTIASPGGQPDDITLDPHGRPVWGDILQGTVSRLQRGRIAVLARHLRVPEGIVALGGGTLVVAEQGTDRILRIGPHGVRRTILQLQPVPGQEGVDGIGRNPRTGALIVPDSPRGRVLQIGPRSKKLRVLARGLGRPVDAAMDGHGNVLVPDEHLGTVIVISPRGAIRRLGSFSIPDDVAVARNGTIWVTSLGDGALWRITPGSPPVRVLSGLGNPQGLTLDRCGNPIVVEQNTARIERLAIHPCR